MDDKVTRALQAWLNTPAAERNIEQGAALLRDLNRNLVLYNSILRQPAKMARKLEYELSKHLKMRLAGLTLREVVFMEQEVKPRVEAFLREEKSGSACNDAVADGSTDAESSQSGKALPHRGRREDHADLPEEIQRIYDENGARWAKIKELYNTLRAMESEKPCDRWEHVHLLAEVEKKYRLEWARYDDWTPEVEERKKAKRAQHAAHMREVRAAKKAAEGVNI